MDRRRPQGRTRGRPEEAERGSFWRGITLDTDPRLRVGRALGKTEEEVAHALRAPLQERGHPAAPPPMATDGNGDDRTALVETWGQVPDDCGRPTQKHPQPDWQYLQGVNERSAYRRTAVHITVVSGDPDDVRTQVGGHTADVERTTVTARQMNGRLVRTTLASSKQVEALDAACAWEDGVSTLTRTVDTRSIPDRDEQGRRRWQRQTPAMEAGLTDHRWTITELLSTVVAPQPLNT